MKLRLLALSCALAVAAFAADVSGKWTAEMPGRGGNTTTSTFTLKADGNNLTGTVAGGRGGEAQITNGKIDGDNLSFDITREGANGSMTMHYTGTVSGDTINFKVMRQGAEGQGREFTAKRSTT